MSQGWGQQNIHAIPSWSPEIQKKTTYPPDKTLAMSKMLPQEPKGDCWQHLPPLQQLQQIHSYEFIAFHFNKTLCLSLSLSHIRSSSYWLSSPALHHPNQAGAVAKFSNQTTWIACVIALLVSGLTIEIGAIGWQKKERGQMGLEIVRRWSSHGRWWLICSC
jgi:hypothetical protein